MSECVCGVPRRARYDAPLRVVGVGIGGVRGIGDKDYLEAAFGRLQRTGAAARARSDDQQIGDNIVSHVLGPQ